MRGRAGRRVASGLVAVAVVAGGPGRAAAQRASPPAPLPADLERFYSAPSLVGTAPRAVTWSPDGLQVAFLWNESGAEFLDVYTADRETGRPVRRSTFPRRAAPEGPATAWATQREALAAELDGGVSAVAWLPDGRRMLATFRGDLWLVAPDRPATRLTETRGAESRAAVAARPRGDTVRVAFVRDGELWVGDLVGDALGVPRRRTRVARDGVGVEQFVWSPDGATFAVVEVDRTTIRTRGIPDHLGEETVMPMVRRAFPGEDSEQRRVGLVAAAGGEVRWLALGGAPTDVLHGLAWSPDGARLAVDRSDVFVKDRRVLVAEAATGAVRELVREQEPLNVSAEWQVAWRPDGAGVYFTSDREQDYHVWYAPLAGGAPHAITRGAWAVFGFAVTPAGLVVVTNRDRPEERHVERVPLDGGAPVRLTRQPGTHAPAVSPDGAWLASVHSSDGVPPDLHLVGPVPRGATAPAEPRRATTSPRAEFALYRFTTPRYVTFPSRADGAVLHGRLLLPPGYDPARRWPVIIGSAYSNTARNQWGGRNAHPLWGLDQVLLERGFVILAVDVAGSSGHGTAFRRRIRLDYGGIDVEDLHSGVEWLVREGIADPARVGIWGSSYGGLLTTMSLFTKPDVYAAGVAGAPATNVWHALTGEQRVMGRPQEHPTEYARASSHTRAAGLAGRLMLIHGMRDVVVLYKDSAWLTQYLLQLGKDVELVTLPDAGHGWDLEGLAQTRFAFRALVRFFERSLLGAGAPPGRR